jgi:hypothetical protein
MDVYARRRLVAILAIVLVLVLIGVAVAGGGGDEDEPPITTVAGASTPGVATALTQREFIQEGDAICEEAAAAIANLDSTDTQSLAEDELSTTESELDQLRSLAPPEEDQATLDDFFTALEDLVAALDKRALALDRADDDAAASAETEIDTAKSDLAGAADDYGFKECGRDAEPGTGTNATAPDTGAVAPVTPTTPTTTAPPAVTTTPSTETPPSDSGGTGGSGGGGGGSDSGGVSP